MATFAALAVVQGVQIDASPSEKKAAKSLKKKAEAAKRKYKIKKLLENNPAAAQQIPGGPSATKHSTGAPIPSVAVPPTAGKKAIQEKEETVRDKVERYLKNKEEYKSRSRAAKDRKRLRLRESAVIRERRDLARRERKEAKRL